MNRDQQEALEILKEFIQAECIKLDFKDYEQTIRTDGKFVTNLLEWKEHIDIIDWYQTRIPMKFKDILIQLSRWDLVEEFAHNDFTSRSIRNLADCYEEKSIAQNKLIKITEEIHLVLGEAKA